MRRLVTLTLCVGLCSCGGGGGGDSAAPPPVNTPNQPPTISSTTHAVNEDTDLVASVQANDPENGAVTFTRTSDPANGQVTRFEANGGFTYRPGADFSGTDSFGVRATDPANNTANATVTITINAVNDAPRGNAVNVQFTEDVNGAGQVAATDPEGDAVTFAHAGNGAKGTVAVQSNGSFTYAPTPNAFGPDTFEIEARDALGATSRVRVDVTIQGVNDAPQINNDFLTVAGAATIRLDVLANDVDPDQEPLTLTVETGTLVFGQSASVANGQIEVVLPTPDPFHGDQFFSGFGRLQYRAQDASGQGSVATVVFFVDTEPFRAIYASNHQTGRMQLYVDDLASARRVSDFTAGTFVNLGRLFPSQNGRTIVYEGFTSFTGPDLVVELWAAPADGSTPSRKITPVIDLFAGERLNVRSLPSPDGNWVVYGIFRNGIEELYLADLRPGGTSVVLPNPAGGAIESDFFNIVFGPTSRFVYYTAEFQFTGVRGQAAYRVSVADPGNRQLLSLPPAADRFALTRFVSPDESTVVLSTFANGVAAVDRFRPLQAGAQPERISHALAAGDFLSSFVADESLIRVAYLVQTGNLPDPQTFRLYRADTDTLGSGVLVGEISTEFVPPNLTAIHPSRTEVLLTTSFVGPTGARERLSRIALAPGSSLETVAERITALPQLRYSGAGGGFIAYMGDPNTVRLVKRSDLASSTPFCNTPVFAHAFSPDTNVIAVTTGPFVAFHAFLCNRTATGSLQLTGVTDPGSSTFDVSLIPRN